MKQRFLMELRHKKTLFVGLLSLLTLLIPIQSYAASITVDGIWYNIHEEEGTASVRDNNKLSKVDLVIPDYISYNGVNYPVTEIEDVAFARANITGSLTIGNSVTRIGSSAFSGCSGLNGNLTIGNNVKIIDSWAFGGCKGLTGSLTIPNSVTIIGRSAFQGCAKFSGSLIIPDSVIEIGEQAFSDCYGFTGSLVISNSVTTIGSNAFNGCSGFTGSLTIPNSVTTLGGGAFRYCSGFTGMLTIGNSVTAIEEVTFENCSGFTGSLVIPNSVTTIGNNAFENCTGFTGSLIIGNSVATIEYGAFRNCRGFTGSLTLGNSVTTIGKSSFEDCGFTGSLVIPNSVTTIENNAFFNSHFTGSLTIGNSVTAIGMYAFWACSNFTGSLTIGNSVATIGPFAFNGCSGFTGSLEIPNSVTEIGEAAFSGCSGFTGSLKIPNSVTKIYNMAFSGCRGFTGSLKIPNSLTKICAGVFSYCRGFTGSLEIPNSVTEIGASAFRDCSGFTGLTIGDSVTAIANSAFEDCTGFTGSLIIPNSVTAIGGGAFKNCTGFTGSLTIGDSVTKIYEYAFQYTNFESIKFPYKLQQIGQWAFYLGRNGNSNIICDAETPPECSEKGVFNTYRGPLYVPAKSISLYKTAHEWKNFYDIRGIGEISVESIGLNVVDVQLKATETVQLAATVLPEDATDKSVVWSSNDESVATVDETGLVTAVKVGKTTITATSANGLKAECEVTVVATPVASITLNKTAASLKATETVQLAATVLPEDATDKSVVWSSNDESVAIVDETGLVTAVKVGKATITATSAYGLKAECEITVVETPVGSVVIDLDALGITGDNLEMKIGEIKTLKVTVEPETATDKTVSFASSDLTVVSVDSNGKIIALSLGDAKITVTAKSGASASVNVKVVATPVASISLNKTAASLKATETVQLTATVLPEDATDKSVTWSSNDETVAIVDETGLVTAGKVGKATITATSANGLKAECEVTVVETPVGSVVIDLDALGVVGDNLEMKVGDTKTIKVTIEPTTATDKTVSFASSDPSVVSVDSKGKITALSLGDAIITVTAKSGASVSVNVKVVATPVESITLNKTAISLKVTETVQLIAIVLPNDATDRSVIWSSSNESVATVDENGFVKAVSVGNAIINARTINGLEAVCNITVEDIFPTNITIDLDQLGLTDNKLYLAVGKSKEIRVVFTPDDVTNKELMFSSSDPLVVSVSSEGVVSADNPGEAVITVKAVGGAQASVNVVSYSRPHTPTQLLRKGDGASHTFVAMSDLADKDLGLLGYKFVFGFADGSNTDHIIAASKLRYCRASEDVYWNTNYRFWVYCEVENTDGSIITSGKRYLDGSVDEDFDGSVFGGKGVQSEDGSNPDNWIRITPKGVVISVANDFDTEIMIYDMQGHVIRRTAVNAGEAFSESVGTGNLSGGIYVVRVVSGNNSVTRKVVIR